MAKRNLHTPQEIKEMVLNAAQTIVIEQGFAALKAREIAMKTDYTVGGIYMVFDNMADLIMQLKGRTLDDMATALETCPQQLTPELQLIELAKAYLAFARQNFNRWRMLFGHQLTNTEQTPQWYQQKLDAGFEKIERLFQELAPQTSFIQQRQAAHALWSGIHGVCMLALTDQINTSTLQEAEKQVLLLTESFIKGWNN